eukprot:9591434-Alexandrium_andersonii.AAC.1
MLIASPRADSAGGASGVAGEAPGRPESSGVPGGALADGERRAAQRKDAAAWVSLGRGPAECSHARKSGELCRLQLGRVRRGGT